MWHLINLYKQKNHPLTIPPYQWLNLKSILPIFTPIKIINTMIKPYRYFKKQDAVEVISKKRKIQLFRYQNLDSSTQLSDALNSAIIHAEKVWYRWPRRPKSQFIILLSETKLKLFWIFSVTSKIKNKNLAEHSKPRINTCTNRFSWEALQEAGKKRLTLKYEYKLITLGLIDGFQNKAHLLPIFISQSESRYTITASIHCDQYSIVFKTKKSNKKINTFLT